MNHMQRQVAAIVFLSLLTATCREAPRRPVNILFISIDTFRADRVGALTPALARLGNEGIRFDAADSPVPLTLPAHASLLSGLWPLHHGLRNNGVGAFPNGRDTLGHDLFARRLPHRRLRRLVHPRPPFRPRPRIRPI
jgi:hypothetical protein